MKSIKFSIIIPVYNGEKHIEKCLNSIENQTYSNYEVIVINDGSTDDTLSILKNYDVEIIDKENEGQGIARNRGINKAKGDYILFVDADDFLDKKTLEKINEILENKKYDIITYGYIIEEKPLNSFLLNIEGEIKEDFSKLLSKKYYFSVDTAYCKAFLKNNNIFFGEGYIYEDYEFWLKVCINVKSAYVTRDKMYNIVKHKNSSTFQNRDSMKHFDDFFKAFDSCEKIIKDNPEYDYNYFYRYILNRFLSYYMNRIPKKHKKSFRRKFVNKMSNINLKTFHNKNYDVLLKLNIFLYKRYFIFWLYCILFEVKNWKRHKIR